MMTTLPDREPQTIRDRSCARVAAVVQVSVTSGHNFWTGLTQNVSKGGLFLATEVLLDVGASLSFALQLEPDPTIHRLTGRVRWVRPCHMAAPGLPAGMGVQLEDMSDELMCEIQQFIGTRRDSLYFDRDDEDSDEDGDGC